MLELRHLDLQCLPQSDFRCSCVLTFNLRHEQHHRRHVVAMLSKLCHDQLLHRSTRTRRGAWIDLCSGAVKISRCGSSRKCLRKTSASAPRRPKTSLSFHSYGSFSSGLKTTSSFLEPFDTKEQHRRICQNSAKEPSHGWRASVSATWVGVKGHICLSPRIGLWSSRNVKEVQRRLAGGRSTNISSLAAVPRAHQSRDAAVRGLAENQSAPS